MTSLSRFAASVGLAMLGLSFFAHPAAAQSDASWQALRSLVGSYPSVSPAGGKSPLMKTAPVRDALAALLTPAQRAELNTYAVSPPVAAIGKDLVAQFCLPHDCGSESAFMVIDPDTQTIWIAFYTSDGKIFHTNWTGTADPANVPPAILAAMSKVHTPF